MHLPSPTEVGRLGVYQLKRAWARAMAARNGRPFPADVQDFHFDHLVIDALGLGLEQTIQHLQGSAPSFDAFEDWIVAMAGTVDAAQIARINLAIAGRDYPDDIKRWIAEIDASEPVLSGDDLSFWDEHGYVILHDAVPADTREAATRAIYEHLGARPDDPQSWYRERRNGIMVQFFQHPAFTANRRSSRIHKAYAQLWGTSDLWVTTDRVGFNVPERERWRFPGPDLHWDVSLQMPMYLNMQGILYLTDTPGGAGRVHLRARIPPAHRGVAGKPPGGRRSAPGGFARTRLATDRRTRGRPGHLERRPAARQPPEPRQPAAHRAIHQNVSDPAIGPRGLEVTAWSAALPLRERRAPQPHRPATRSRRSRPLPLPVARSTQSAIRRAMV
jgi:hypothetical protein